MAYSSYSGGRYAYARYVLYYSNCTHGVYIVRLNLGWGLLGMLCEAHSHTMCTVTIAKHIPSISIPAYITSVRFTHT